MHGYFNIIFIGGGCGHQLQWTIEAIVGVHRFGSSCGEVACDEGNKMVARAEKVWKKKGCSSIIPNSKIVAARGGNGSFELEDISANSFSSLSEQHSVTALCDIERRNTELHSTTTTPCN